MSFHFGAKMYVIFLHHQYSIDNLFLALAASSFSIHFTGTTGEHSGSVVESLTRDRGAAVRVRASTASLRHCVLVLEQDTFILA